MKRLTLAVVAVVVLLGLTLLSSIVSQGFEELARAEKQRNDLEREKHRLEQRIVHLQETLAAVSSDDRAVESLARRDLGWVRPGETVIYLADPPPVPRPEFLTHPVPTPILSLPD